MKARREKFTLSARGRLHLAIVSVYSLSSIPAAYAGGITAAQGPGGMPQVDMRNGVPIVNIVAPNDKGLSHNQFLEYNVGGKGVVLNNAQQAALSQILGQTVGANPQLNHGAANVILNEVTGQNPSAINGAQEILGKAATLILANPNGISVNGASFINVPAASLVVGRPTLEDGAVKSLDTINANGALTVGAGGLTNSDGAISLIAPSIDSQGRISAAAGLNAIVGSNRVDTAGKVLETADADDAKGRIDARLYGAMQAGRINIVSTAAGAGINMGAVTVSGTDGVQVASAGDIDVSGKTHRNSLLADRAVVTSEHGDIALHGGGKITLAAATVSGNGVDIEAKDKLGIGTLTSTAETHAGWFQPRNDRTETGQHGSSIEARQDVRLKSGADADLIGSNVTAGENLNVDTGGNLNVTAALESTEAEESSEKRHLQQVTASRLQSGKAMALSSAGDVQAEGASVDSGGKLTVTGKNVDIDSKEYTQSTAYDRFDWFDPQHRSYLEHEISQHQGSDVQVGGALDINADHLRILGSKLAVKDGIDIDAASDVVIGSVANQDVEHSGESRRGAPLPFVERDTPDSLTQFRGGVRRLSSIEDKTESNTVQQASTVRADHIRIRAADVTVDGSNVSAGAGGLSIDADGVNLLAGKDDSETVDHTRKFKTDFYITAGTQKVGSGEKTTFDNSIVTRKSSTAHASILASDGDAEIHANDSLVTRGARLDAGKNAVLTLTADKINNQAATTSTSVTDLERVGLAAGGDVDVAFDDVTQRIDNILKDAVSIKLWDTGRGLVSLVRDGQLDAGLSGDGDMSHSRSMQGTTTPLVTQYGAGRIVVNASQLNDTGTSYQAGNGRLRIQSDHHASHAAFDTSEKSSSAVDISTGDRLYTKMPWLMPVPFGTVGVKGTGALAFEYKNMTNATPVVSRYGATDGITIDLGRDGYYEGSDFAAGAGPLDVAAKGMLEVDQANATQTRSEDTLGARLAGDLTVDTRLVKLGGGVSGDGRGSFHHLVETSRDARVATVQGAGNIRLSGDAGVTVRGADIGSEAKPVGNIVVESDGETKSLAADSNSTTDRLDGSIEIKPGVQADVAAVRIPRIRSMSGSFGADGDLTRIHETRSGKQAGAWHSDGEVTLRSTSLSNAAVRIEGTGINAPTRIRVDAPNGGFQAESAQTEATKRSWKINPGIDVPVDLKWLAHMVNHQIEQSLEKSGETNAKVPVAVPSKNEPGPVQSRDDAVTALPKDDPAVAQPKNGGTKEPPVVEVHADLPEESVGQTGDGAAMTANTRGEQPGAVAVPELAHASAGNFDVPDDGWLKLGTGLDLSHELSNQNAEFKTGEFVINTRQDAKFLGANVNATSIQGGVGGNLVLESRRKIASKLILAGVVDVTTKQVRGIVHDFFSAPLTDRIKSGIDDVVTRIAGSGTARAVGSIFQTDRWPKLRAGITIQDRDVVVHPTGLNGTEGVNLRVDGTTSLTGARISAPDGEVSLGDSRVVRSDVGGKDALMALHYDPRNSFLNTKSRTNAEDSESTEKIDTANYFFNEVDEAAGKEGAPDALPPFNYRIVPVEGVSGVTEFRFRLDALKGKVRFGNAKEAMAGIDQKPE